MSQKIGGKTYSVSAIVILPEADEIQVTIERLTDAGKQIPRVDVTGEVIDMGALHVKWPIRNERPLINMLRPYLKDILADYEGIDPAQIDAAQLFPE